MSTEKPVPPGAEEPATSPADKSEEATTASDVQPETEATEEEVQPDAEVAQVPATESETAVVEEAPVTAAESVDSTVLPANERYVAISETPEFDNLRKALRKFVFPMTVAFLVWYALYVLLSAYARDFMHTKVVGHINVALIFGLLQFVSTFLIAWAYARYADKKIDPLADRLRAEAEGTGGAE
jgi:uncharacterized membrane protein (DUF485 family)